MFEIDKVLSKLDIIQHDLQQIKTRLSDDERDDQRAKRAKRYLIKKHQDGSTTVERDHGHEDAATDES